MTDTTTRDADTTEATIDAYFEMWRATDADERRSLVERVFTPEGRHVDPNADAQGHDELVAMITAVHEGFAGFGIERTSGVDQHGDQLRFAWRMDAADGSTLVEGIDVAELAEGGRLARVAGFWGPLPEV